jgi:acyl-CoA synthetase (AMP-forming)/AMP-acid ligase II
LWGKIADYCSENSVTLPTMRRVLCAGAPVPSTLWEKSRQLLPNGLLHSPYGATECLPVSTIAATDVDPAAVRGACVGRPVPEMEVRVIDLVDGPLGAMSEARQLGSGEVGEFAVRGPVVTKRYDALPDATAGAKIPDGDTLWHRLGDCGYLDERGALWFCGRKVERVRTSTGDLYTEPCEQVFRSHPAVERCALVGLGAPGQQEPALVVQRRKRRANPDVSDAALAAELRERAGRHPHTASIRRFYFHPAFPVDVRHNAKIHRLTLAKWAATAKPVVVSGSTMTGRGATEESGNA